MPSMTTKLWLDHTLPPMTRFTVSFLTTESGATLDYPNASATVLVGITNADAIVGNAFVNASTTPFLHKNGTFKIIVIPNSDPGTQGLLSISPKLGLILGVTDARTGKSAFIAHCQ